MRLRLALLATASLLAAAPALAQSQAPAPPTAGSSDTAPVAAMPAPEAAIAPEISATPDDGEEMIVTGRAGPPPGDPLEAINLQSYEVVQVVDTNVVGPAAAGYKKAIPEPIRAGVRNFFNNLTAPATFLNFLLQFKVGKAAETAARFGVNSTIGVAGLVDVAKRKPFRMPLRRNGFANTFGFYGIKPGPFLFLPLVGPTTVRDLIGLSLDKAILPLSVGAPFGQPYYTLPSTAVSSLDYRNQFDEQLRKLRESPDPYAASRDFYLRNRQEEIDALRHPGRAAKPVAPIGPLADPIEAVDPEDEGAPPPQERF